LLTGDVSPRLRVDRELLRCESDSSVDLDPLADN
jgi:hypothetical protein